MAERRIVICDVCRAEAPGRGELTPPTDEWGMIRYPEVRRGMLCLVVCPECVRSVRTVLGLRLRLPPELVQANDLVSSAEIAHRAFEGVVLTRSADVVLAKPAQRSAAVRALEEARANMNAAAANLREALTRRDRLAESRP